MPKPISRAEFIGAAPAYYALAIADYFIRNGGPAYQASIEGNYTFGSEDGPDVNYLENNILFDQGALWLEERGMIEPIHDLFGPTVYRPTDRFQDGWQNEAQDRQSPFYKYNTLQEPRRWLIPALRRLNEVFDSLEIKEEDFADIVDEWQPLPLDRENDISLQRAIQALDQVAHDVRVDNGYAASQPEERDLVLESIEGAARKLKTAQTISVPYLRQYVLEPIDIVLKRFKDAALSITATAAREAVVEFIKAHAGHLLELLWRSF